MNPLTIYDYLTKAREKVFDAVRELSPEQYQREFNFGLKTLGSTLTHLMIVEWAYSERVQQHDLPPYEQWPIQDEKPPAFSVIESTWRTQSPHTRAVFEELYRSGSWDKQFEYVSQARPAQGDGRLVKTRITVTPAEIFTQMTLHEMHHRAQIMVMLRELGTTLIDLDFSYLMFKRQRLDD